jgi:hypothetical protein
MAVYSLNMSGKVHTLCLSSHIVPFDKLIVAQLVKTCSASFENRRFINLLTRTCYWFLSWARWNQFSTFHFVSVRSILIFFSMCVYFSKVISSLQVSRLNFCMHSAPLPCVLMSQPPNPPWLVVLIIFREYMTFVPQSFRQPEQTWAQVTALQ